MWNLQPGVARQYLQEVSASFEQYAEANYVPAMCETEDADLRLGAVRFVATREVHDQEWCLRELFTFPTPRKQRREMETAIADALVRTSQDPDSTARFLVDQYVGVRESSKARVFEDALRELDRDGPDAVLLELEAADEPRRIRQLGRLLVNLTRVQPPEPVARWDDYDAEYRGRVIEVWRRHLVAAGKASPPEEAEDEASSEGEPPAS